MTSVAFLQKAGGTIVVFVDGKPHNVDPSSLNYTKIVEALELNDYESLVSLLNIRDVIADYSDGKIEIFGDDLFFDKKQMKGALAERIIHMFKNNLMISPFVKFMEKVEQNPLQSAREELFLFAESNNLPICPDGDFLAYKFVDKDYYDCHSRTILNTVNTIVKMDRTKVDPDRQQTCSYGLHVCSYSYAESNAHNKRLMVVKINPSNVVAIPYDYNNQKMRVCEYVVVDEMQEFADLLEKNYTEDYREYDIDDIDDSAWEESDSWYDSSCEYDNEWTPVLNNETISTRQFNKSVVKSENKSSKLSEDDVRKIRELLDDEWTLAGIAREFNISPRQVARIRDGESWVHIK